MTDAPIETRPIELRPSEAFLADVLEGLRRPQKSIPCCWLYDERGSALFEAITALDDYYLTRAELEILSRHRLEIAEFCGRNSVLLDYGAGAGRKAEYLISVMDRRAVYAPIDIAGEMLAATTARIGTLFPGLTVMPVSANFAEDFDLPEDLPDAPRAGFFPGSTLGNFDRRDAVAFLSRLRQHLDAQGRAIVGVDLKKDKARLLRAYDDREGVTAAFNLNLLERINRELGANFAVENFFHEARWSEQDAAVEMHLVSRDRQSVLLDDHAFDFLPGESIHTESSRKYDHVGFQDLAMESGWRIAHVWQDANGWFAVFGLQSDGLDVSDDRV